MKQTWFLLIFQLVWESTLPALKTYFKISSCIHLFLTNRPRSFYARETGLYYFHMMTISVMKICYRKMPPKIISYKDNMRFSNKNILDSVKGVFLNKKKNKYRKWWDRFIQKFSVDMHRARKSTYEVINISLQLY